MAEVLKLGVELPTPHPEQAKFVFCDARRIMVRAGRRSGKTVGAAIRAVLTFTKGKRVLYAAPTAEQTGKFWFEVCNALAPLFMPQTIEINGRKQLVKPVFRKNEDEQFIERIGTEQRLKAKTGWNVEMLRGDFADEILFDEFHLMNESIWVVGAPMLLDRGGTALFFYTPPSLDTQGQSRAKDPLHAAKMFKKAQKDTTGRWKTFHFTSHANIANLDRQALAELIQDMSQDAYRHEILAEDEDLEASWLVFSAFDGLRRRVERFSVPLSWPVYTFHDFGAANPAALFVARAILPLPKECPLDVRQGDYVVFKEYLPGAGRSAAQHALEFREITAGRNVVARIGGSHQEEEIRQGYAALGWPITEPLTRGVARQVDKVIQLFEQNRVFIFSDVYNYLEEIMSCTWEAGLGGEKTDKIRDEARFHLCAAARYGFSHPDFVSTAITIPAQRVIETLHFPDRRIPFMARR